MSGVRRALAFSVGERYLMLVVALGSNMIIARLLTPEAIGIYSVSLAVIGIAQVMRDFGVASYLIQETNLTDSHIRTAFGILLIMGIGVAGVLLLAAPYIATLYHEPAMVSTLRICALNFFLLPFTTVSLALLRRGMQFKRLAAVNIAASVAAAVVSVGLAWLGMGVISLAIGSVALNSVTGLGAWIMRTDRRLLLPSLSEWRRVFSFGAQSSVTGIVTSLAMDTNDLAVGKIMGFAPVAILSRAQGLMNMFHRDLMGAVRNVAYPAYAKARREEQALEPVYVASVTNVTVVAWPFYGFLSLFPHQILSIMYGPQWDAAAPLVPVFCLAGAIAAASSLAASVMLAAGRVDLVTKVELLFQPFRAVLIVVAALVFKTTMACAVALVLALLVQLPMVYAFKQRCVPNHYASLLHGFKRSACVTAACLAGPAVMALFASQGGVVGVMWCLSAGVLCVLGWFAAAIYFRHPLADDPLFLKLVGRLGALFKRAPQP